MQEIASKESDSRIFLRKDILDLGYLPDLVFHRDREIGEIWRRVNDFFQGVRPYNLLIFGETGTGKTVIIQHVARRLETEASAKGCKLKVVYVPCTHYSNEHDIIRRILEVLEGCPVKTGHYPSVYRDMLISHASQLQGLLIILDDADRLLLQSSSAWQPFLFILSREVHMASLAMVTNDIRVREVLETRLNHRTRETFPWDPISFPAYTAPELSDILKARAKEAFQPGVLDDEDIARIVREVRKRGLGARGLIQTARRVGEELERGKISKPTIELIIETTESSRDQILIEPLIELDDGSWALLMAIAKMRPCPSDQLKRCFKEELAPSIDIGASDRAYYWHLGKLKQMGIVTVARRSKNPSGVWMEFLQVAPGMMELLNMAANERKERTSA